jgi:hypothetical protein
MDFLGDWDPNKAAPRGKRVPEVPARPFGKSLAQLMATPPTPNVATPPREAPAKHAPVAASAPRVPSALPPKPVTIPPRPAPAPSGSRPLSARPAPPPAAARPLAPIIPGTTPAKPATATAASGIDERVRELHARFVEAKRQTQDGAAVSLEGLAKSMKATEAKLREQHKNRKIDFDVVIKDGKAVLKPIVR